MNINLNKKLYIWGIELMSSAISWSVETILHPMNYAMEVANNHSSCLFMLLWIAFPELELHL